MIPAPPINNKNHTEPVRLITTPRRISHQPFTPSLQRIGEKGKKTKKHTQWKSSPFLPYLSTQ
ncbi:unnamed protein product [Tuber melanosporum]|uniref:(Perigord truffle) hypothetical protein n=1 Tax=Tuber melanosporum (strain Mel28) TaxID=656061 RepID=D5G7A9_TUBMM|nr:uncharacterized protein GSTUM_00002419001 [Tuber melanosporum]CAZ80402.1 unnamed protein product [Tuber melanosporum]